MMRYAKQALLLLVMVLVPLNGCATERSDGPCLTVQDYPAEIQMRVADEISSLGAQSETAAMMADYGRLRAEARAVCR
ncbi:MAG: hypothetical protein Q7T44_10885 [Parvibaculum sp.]|nr:hypothetical protein [Parvibaculum sp.]